MKRKSASQSAFLSPRMFLGVAICLTGISLAVIGFGSNFGAAAPVQKASQAQSTVSRPTPDVVRMVGPVSQSRDLRSLPYIPQGGESEDEIRMTRHPRLKKTNGTLEKLDSFKAVKRLLQPAVMPTPIATYPGITSAQSACGCLPPDTDGDVGPNHYIQSVNSRIKILDKAGNQLLAPTTYNTFFSALGPATPCGANQNQGDGVVFYDHMADRWVVSDFAFPSFPGVLFYQCIGVSQTSDPVAGGWYLYAVQVDPSNPNYIGDYPKFGLWPDAYYMTVNLFSNNTTFNGSRVYALDRNSMINGGSANVIAFGLDPATLGDSYSLVPAGFRTGNPPPTCTPEYLLSIDSPANGGVPLTQIHAWRFHVDFVNPANSVFGVGANHAPDAQITVPTFVDAFSDAAGGNLVPQNGTVRLLDSLGDKIMYPLVYHSLNGVESLWASHTIYSNADGTGPMAVRWYQFNVTGSTIPAGPVQSQTWNNGADGLYRWMPSIAVDAGGNVAIGYSTSSSTMEPSIRYAGRLAIDAPNNLGQGEAIMQAGGGHQTSASGRWGDYSALGIDPADPTVFWHTNEYYSATAGAAWNTRIGNFRFPTQPVQIMAAASRLTHGAAGPFDIPLSTSMPYAIECRNSGGNYTFVFTFNNNVVSGSAVVDSGTVGGLSTTFSANTMTVSLTGVTNVQTVAVRLTGVTDAFTQVLADTTYNVKMLIGDVNASSSVSATDFLLTKAQLGNPVCGTNFRNDINANGAISGSDVLLEKAHSGEGL